MRLTVVDASPLDATAVGRRIHTTWVEQGGRLAEPLLFEGLGHRGAPEGWLPQILEAASVDPLEYIGGNSPRTKLVDAVYTSTEYPQQETLSLHQELSYEVQVPDVLLFVCVVEPSQGGETPVCDAAELLQALPTDLTTRFATLGVRYHQLLPADERRPGKTWMDQFQTDRREQCEELLAERSLRYCWQDDGALRIERQRDAVRPHPVTGASLWFNQADQWDIGMSMDERRRVMFERMHGADAAPHAVRYGDGSDIALDDLRLIKQAALDLAAKPAWKQGNVLVLDNRQHLHGRMPFEGDRRILVSMGDLPRPS